MFFAKTTKYKRRLIIDVVEVSSDNIIELDSSKCVKVKEVNEKFRRIQKSLRIWIR